MVLDYMETFLGPAPESPHPPLCLNLIHAQSPFSVFTPPSFFSLLRQGLGILSSRLVLTTQPSPAWCLTRGNPPASLMMG